ncbi:hypothetical protein [Parafilimonas sp.]|uniref:hypothetical protein n=1 Tax=Parafilimonas sp. TaxID=1969739 RepID=UPI0039E5A9E9
MRTALSILFCCIVLHSFAQDDIPDYRTKKDNFLKMQEKDIRADLAQFTFGGISESLTKHRLNALPLESVSNDTLVFSNDTAIVQITAGGFDAAKHKVTWYDDKYAVKLDNRPFWGTENKVPTRSITSVVAVIESDTVVVPAAAYGDLYEPKLYYTDAKGKQKTFCNVYRSPDNRKYYIYMVNGEGAGRYEVTWVIQDRKYLRRVVDWGF